MPSRSHDTGLILTGGGARAAYQVGVLDALRELLREAGHHPDRLPFDVICGTSAGAMNAAALATHCDDFHGAVGQLLSIWSSFHAHQVYRTDLRGSLGNAARWLGSVAFGWLARASPRSLFDNAPLSALLRHLMDFERMRRGMADGKLQALAISASSYTSGQHVTYYESREPVPPWSRTQRLACPATIDYDHLLASSAIPFVFPAVPLSLGNRREYFGDGSIRQIAPISPAIHLGANRILIVGVGQIQAGTQTPAHTGSQYLYPNLAQIAGHAMAGIFLDALANDLERLRRINATISLIPEERRGSSRLRPIEVLLISPSQRLDSLAARHVRALPWTVRTLLRTIGATEKRGAALASYLLFEADYLNELITLGRLDTLRQRRQVLEFFDDR